MKVVGLLALALVSLAAGSIATLLVVRERDGSSARFDAASIYASRSGSVVTIVADGSTGSGFVTDAAAGLIVTASHVVTDSFSADDPARVHPRTPIEVEFADGSGGRATLVGYDLFSDIALLHVTGPVPPAIPLGASGRLHVGDPIAVIGSPIGERGTLSTGVVSQLGRSLDAPGGVCFLTTGAIQTDAAINGGNSGSPVLDRDGSVIGMATQRERRAAGIAFAVPVDTLRRSITQLVATGRVRYAWLGVDAVTLTPGIELVLHTGAQRGALIRSVQPGGAAAAAGLRGGSRTIEIAGERYTPGGDVITQIGSDRVRSYADLDRAIQRRAPGDRVRVRTQRTTVELELFARAATARACR